MTEKILKLTLKKSATLFFVAIFVFSTGFNLSMPFVAYGDESTEAPVQLTTVEEVTDNSSEPTAETEDSTSESGAGAGEILGDTSSDDSSDRDVTGEEIGLDDETPDPLEPIKTDVVINDQPQVCINGDTTNWSLSYFNSEEGQGILNADPNDDTYAGHCESKEGSGTIRICKIVLDAEGNIVDGSNMDSTFEISGIEPINLDPSTAFETVTFNTPLTLNANLVGDDKDNDAECTSFEMPVGNYYYGEEVITGGNWLAPQYSEYNVFDSIDDADLYDGVLFDENLENDEGRNINSDGHMPIYEPGQTRTLVVVNQMAEESEYSPYCGDGKINQPWEACDGGESCTDTCQSDNQCTDQVFARVIVENVINDSPETGNVSSNIYLGGSENPQILPSGTWFPIYDGTNYLTDVRATGSAYFNVPGVAVQRTYTGGSSKLLTGIYGHDLGGATLEHVDGHIEFSNNISPVSLLNGPGSLGLENGFDGTGFGGVDHNNDEVRLNGDVSEFSLGTMVKGDAFYTVLSKPVSCDGGYCGDHVVNQDWEACDGGEGCTQTCQFEDQCTDKAFARLVVDQVINNTEDAGDVTSNVYLGGSENPQILPNGTWFMIYDGVNYPTDTRTTGSLYFKVPGIGVQRLNNGGVPKILAGIYGHDLMGQTLEHVDGTLEFSGNTGAVALFDGPGSLGLEAGFNGTGFGGTDHNDDEVRLNGDAVEFSLGTKVKGDAFAVSYSAPEACDDGDDEENVCEANVNLMQNGSFETDEVGSSWSIFDSGTISWLANWLNPIGAPAIAKIELQGNGLNGWTTPFGDQWAELDSDWGYANNESGATEIYQDIPTVAGETYTVSYAFSPRPGVVDNTLVALAEEVVKDTVSADGSALSNTDWENRSYTFTATDTSSKIAFKNTDTSDSLGTFLDNVTVVCNVDDGGNGGEEGYEEICGNGIDDDGDQLIDEDCPTDGGGNGGSSSNGGGSSRSSSGSSGTVLGDNTGNGDGEVLGESLAATGTENVSYIVLSALILAFLVATKRKQSII